MSLRKEMKEYISCRYTERVQGEQNWLVEHTLSLLEERINKIIEKLDSHDDKIKISALKQVKEIIKNGE